MLCLLALVVSSSGSAVAAGGSSGAAVSSPSATTLQKLRTCLAANRKVVTVATASKKIAGHRYGVSARSTLSLCTTTTNRTTVFATRLSLTPTTGGVARVKVESGTTTRSTSAGVTTLRTPLRARAKWLFTTYRVTATLVTTVNSRGKVTSQITQVKRA